MGVDGYGCQLQRSDMADPPGFAAIAGVVNVKGPEISRETYDSTHHASPDAYRQFVGGLKEAGEVSLEVRYDPRDHDVLIADFQDTEPRDYRLVWPAITGAQWDVKGIMNGFKPEGPHDDLLTAEITIKVTGKPVFS
ncbi:phage tail tube protein [Sphaerisporangium sp. NPDC049003]|uniref:phage tail tube protein n=1 Tax=Sphaerisporangium sp. NPDC049003 TaxID=3364517 RepID=UPI0037141CE6